MNDKLADPAAQAAATIRQAETLLAQLLHQHDSDGRDPTGAALAAAAALAELAHAGLPTPLPDPAVETLADVAEVRRLLRDAAGILRGITVAAPDQTLAVGVAINHLDHAASLL
jgi:hypothetical protein